MYQLFNSNPFGSLLPAETAAAITEGLNGNYHYAFEFEPGCGGALFAEHLAKHFTSGERLLFNADIHMATGDEHLVKILSRSFVQTFAGDLGRIEGALKKLIPTATPRLVMDESPHVDIDYGAEPDKLFSNLIDLPELMGIKEGRNATVIWSGFCRIEEIFGAEGPRFFTDKVHTQTVTNHIMIGSGVTKTAQKLNDRVSGRVRIFNGTGLVPSNILEAFLIEGSMEGEGALNAETAATIVRLANGKLEAALNIAKGYSCYCGSVPDAVALARAMDDILASAASAYEQVWELLNPRQRGVLYGLTRSEDKSIYSEWFIKEFGFKTATNLQAAIRALDAKGILYKRGKRWIFSDPFFALWVKRKCR